jgi:nucleotide-binding universal stress UspA family protein
MNANNATHIVVPLINPTHDQAALPVAQTMAKILDARVHAVAAAGTQITLHDLAQQLSVPLENLNTLAIEQADGDLVDAMIRTVDELKQQAMIVLAVRFRDHVPRSKPQSINAIARRILERIHCPILLVPPDRDMTHWRLQKELLPQDGTPGCVVALTQVMSQSPRTRIEYLILRVAGANVGQPTEPGSLATPRYVDHPQYEWEAWGKEFLERICGIGADPRETGIRLMMVEGDPATEILRVAQEQSVDMIILPWHGALGSGRARMVKAVLRDATCPVMLLPQHEDQSDARSG